MNIFYEQLKNNRYKEWGFNLIGQNIEFAPQGYGFEFHNLQL